MAVETTYDLPCGRSLEQLWAQLDAADAHGLSCPHCATARESLRALREATDELAADRVQPRIDLTDRIMSAVRAELRGRGEMLPLDADEPGTLEVSEQAVAVVLRFAADEIDGVRARRCRVRALGVEAGETVLHAELTVAATYRDDLAELLATVRERVMAACAASVGVRLARLDLELADFYDR